MARQRQSTATRRRRRRSSEGRGFFAPLLNWKRWALNGIFFIGTWTILRSTNAGAKALAGQWPAWSDFQPDNFWVKPAA